MKRAFIEYDFPVKDVSDRATKERNIRSGHINALHLWWARRPLIASRVSNYASLIKTPNDEKSKDIELEFLKKLSEYEIISDRKVIEEAKQKILDSNGGNPPKVLDPFSGGGSIPLEALRLGCETYASDLNPVAVLTERATIQYPFEFGKKVNIKQYLNDRSWIKEKNTTLDLSFDTVNSLSEDVRYWGKWVGTRSFDKLKKYYQTNSSTNNRYIKTGYVWAKTIQCKNPTCGVTIPLIKSCWIAKKKSKSIAYKLSYKNKELMVEIRSGDKIDFNPNIGTISNANAVCLNCNTGVPSKDVRKLFLNGFSGEHMLYSVSYDNTTKTKHYSTSLDGDISCFDQAKKDLQSVQEKYLKDWGIEPSPIKPIYTPNGKEYESGGVLYNYVPILLYGYTKWSNLFNERQEIAFITISDYIKKARKKMRELSINDEYANALTTYLALALSRHTSYNSKCCFWEPTGERSFNAFGRQALPMVFDYAEQNPFGVSTGNWNKQINNTVIILNKIDLNDQAGSINVSQGSAMSINHPDQFFDAIFTDPPYYDNVPYSNLSDWFFLRLKSILFDVHPDLFSTPLTPKNDEIIDDLSLFRGMPKAVAKLDDSIRVKDKDDFQDMLSKAFIEFNRILKNDGIITIVYTHKSQEAWDAIINAIIESRLYVTASWPIQTEMLTRLRANRSAAISSSIYMVCRKRNTDEIAYFNEIKHAIKTRIHKKLDQFWAEGIGGSDFFISAIGPAVEVFGKYASVEKLSGEKVSVKELLEYVRQIVSEYALSRILKSPQLGGVDQLTRFYLVWRWTFGNNLVPFDDGNKMALSIGVGLDEHWDKGGIIEKAKDKVKVKSHVERRKDRTFETKIKREYPQIYEGDGVPSGKQTLMLVDILQECLILWDRSDRTSIARLLEASGHRKNDLFWQVAQSISDVLPDGDKEKQTIQGFLLGKESYMKGEVPLDTKDSQQETIFGDA